MKKTDHDYAPSQPSPEEPSYAASSTLRLASFIFALVLCLISLTGFLSICELRDANAVLHARVEQLEKKDPCNGKIVELEARVAQLSKVQRKLAMDHANASALLESIRPHRAPSDDEAFDGMLLKTRVDMDGCLDQGTEEAFKSCVITKMTPLWNEAERIRPPAH